MAVTFTPNIGLAKPTDSELALQWARTNKLAEDNNIIIADQMDIALTAYTPTWIASSSNPNVGAGSIKGEYCKMNGIIWGSFVIRCTDPGTAQGSGAAAFGISLPELLDNTYHTLGTTLADTPGTASVVGEGYMTDNSSVGSSGTVAFDVIRISGVDYMRPITEAYSGKTVRWFGPLFPFAIADGDGLTGTFIYKAA